MHWDVDQEEDYDEVMAAMQRMMMMMIIIIISSMKLGLAQG